MKHSLAIKAENISKQYRLGEVGTGTITHDLNRFWAKIRGKEDPYLKIGEANDRSRKGDSEYVWSLRDINFEIEQGDAVGIIGRNGAGKSTLLKLLSKVTKPTTGSFKVNGRIASLLEVGTGFNPEMTGRENIYLNGAILGMRKHEIDRKFDEIVDFSGVERYIDTPVKRYSSGMYVRLAFAVAAHLESEILIVDEVLAVGDAEFQKKCLGKMGDVSKGEGRTVLFVSHNMAAVKTLCNKGLLLENGKLIHENKIDNIIDVYSHTFNDAKQNYYIGENIIKRIEIENKDNLIFGENFTILCEFKSNFIISNIVLGIVIKDKNQNPIIGINNKNYYDYKINTTNINKGVIKLKIEDFKLLPGKYYLDVFLGDSLNDIEAIQDVISFEIKNNFNNKILNSLNLNINTLYQEKVTWTLEEE